MSACNCLDTVQLMWNYILLIFKTPLRICWKSMGITVLVYSWKQCWHQEEAKLQMDKFGLKYVMLKGNLSTGVLVWPWREAYKTTVLISKEQGRMKIEECVFFLKRVLWVLVVVSAGCWVRADWLAGWFLVAAAVQEHHIYFCNSWRRQKAGEGRKWNNLRSLLANSLICYKCFFSE